MQCQEGRRAMADLTNQLEDSQPLSLSPFSLSPLTFSPSHPLTLSPSYPLEDSVSENDNMQRRLVDLEAKMQTLVMEVAYCRRRGVRGVREGCFRPRPEGLS